MTLATNANQNFSLASGSNNCAAKLNAIASDHVEIISLTSGCTVDFSYIMPKAYSALTIPQTVIYTFGSSATFIQQKDYFTLASSFASCAAPCVFQNSANRTLIVKTPSSGASTLDFYFPVNSAGGTPVVTTTTNTGGGGISAPPPYVPPPPPSDNSTSLSSPAGGTVQIAVVIAIVVVIVALLLGRVSESNPFRQPRSGSAKPRKPSSERPKWSR